MDFGDILDDWDKMTAKPAGKKGGGAAGPRGAASREANRDADDSERHVDPLTAWLRMNPVEDKDKEADELSLGKADERRRLREKAADAVIDLHGLTRDEAWTRLDLFFRDARKQGLEKVMVIHGKGNHSEGEAVLVRTTRRFVESCPYTGEFGSADRRHGGNGATWVLLKEEAGPSARGR